MASKLVTLFIAIVEEVVYPTSADPISELCVDTITIIGLVMIIVLTLQALF